MGSGPGNRHILNIPDKPGIFQSWSRNQHFLTPLSRKGELKAQGRGVAHRCAQLSHTLLKTVRISVISAQNCPFVLKTVNNLRGLSLFTGDQQ